jgi:hypothetical protein
MGSQTVRGQWSSTEKAQLHINVLELRAAQEIFSHFSVPLQGQWFV